jgi:hypothetical protein
MFVWRIKIKRDSIMYSSKTIKTLWLFGIIPLYISIKVIP